MTEFEKTMKYEGGYNEDPNDPGGETNYGISKRYHPDVDIKNLTQEQAFAIYKSDYWDKMHLDGYNCIQYRWKVFDIAFNQGVGTATTFIGKVTKPDTTDGVIELLKLQVARYCSLTVSRPMSLKYLMGWIYRALDTGDGL